MAKYVCATNLDAGMNAAFDSWHNNAQAIVGMGCVYPLGPNRVEHGIIYRQGDLNYPKVKLRCVSNADAGIEGVLNTWNANAKGIIGFDALYDLLAITPKLFMYYLDDGTTRPTKQNICCASNDERAIDDALMATWYKDARSILGFAGLKTIGASPSLNLYMFYDKETDVHANDSGTYLKCASCLEGDAATIASWYNNVDLRGILDIVPVYDVVRSDTVLYCFYLEEPDSNRNQNPRGTMKLQKYGDTDLDIASLYTFLNRTDIKIMDIGYSFGDSPAPLIEYFITYVDFG